MIFSGAFKGFRHLSILMSWVKAFISFTNDHARQVQYFMVCRQLGMILSSIVIARFLTVDEVGVIEQLMLIGYLMTFFWSDALVRGFLATPGFRGDSTYSATVLWLYFLFSLGSMGILLLGQKILLPLLVSRPSLDGLQLFVLYQALIIPVWISPFIGILRGQNTLLLSTYVLIGPAFACWTGFTSLGGIPGALLGLFTYALVAFIWVVSKSKLLKDIQIRSALSLVWPAAWPLALYAISNGLARSFDAWLVARHFDDSIFAIFRYGAREFPLVTAMAAGLGTIMIPRLLQPSGIDELRARSTRLMHISYPVIVILMMISPFLFQFFFGVAYVTSAYIFNIYLLLSLTQLIFPQSIVMARGDHRVLWYISVAELAVNVIASIILLKYLGLSGIAWGTLIAFLFEKCALMIYVSSKYGILPKQIINLNILLLYTLLLAVSFILSVWLSGL